MRKVNLCIVIAISVLACACSDGNGTATFRRSVYLTQPVQVSDNRVKTYSGIVEAAHEINLGFKTAVKSAVSVSRKGIMSTRDSCLRNWMMRIIVWRWKPCRYSMTSLRTRQNGQNSCSSLKACQPTIMKRLSQD